MKKEKDRVSIILIYRITKTINKTMEIGNYRVEIIGGKHISDPNTEYQRPNSSWFGSSWGWSPWSGSPRSLTAFSQEDKPTNKSYVEMRDGDHYSIHINNRNATKCHAKISIEGKCVGTWVLNAMESARIERPADIPKKFTFFKVNSTN